MNYLKTNPVGLDAVIQPMQEALYELSDTWGEMDGFGRVYKNRKNKSVVPEFYKGNGEYVDVLTNDMKVATFFFLEADESEAVSTCLSKTSVDLIFIVDVKKAREDIAHYADEEIRIQVLEIANCFFSKVDSTIKGERALDGITVDNLDFIHPYYIFKIKGIINNY